MDLVIGVDMGTASTKGVLTDVNGDVLAIETVSHETSMPRPGWVEVDPERVWWREICAISRALMSAIPAGGRVVAICISGVGPCLVLCDDELRPSRPAILYGVDTRASAEIDYLTEHLGADRILVEAGSLLSSQAVGPKMLWVQRQEPDVWAGSTRWLGSNSYVAAKLTGEYVIDHHTASQCDPLYAIEEFGWHREWADRICVGIPMPRLCWPGEVLGTVHRRGADETGLPEGLPVVAGTVDAFAEAFSVGVRAPGDQMLMYGSTMFLVQVIDEMHRDRSLWATVGVEKQTRALAAGTSTSGQLISWLQSVTGNPSFDEVTAETMAVPPGSGGLLLLPYLAGERTPVFDPNARGVFAGLTLSHTRGHLFRAAYEGIAFGIRQILEMFDDAHTASRTVAVGGGLRSPIWAQAVSDITGRTQLVPEQTIGASFGDALLAAIAVNLVGPETDWTRPAREIAPDLSLSARYDDLYQTWRELYPATADQVHRLALTQEP